MSKFNSRVPKAQPVANKAGGVAFAMSPETELIHAVLTTFLDEKYYESSKDRKDRIAQLVTACDPQFVSNLAVVARKEFNLRSVSHVLVGELSKEFGGEAMKKLIVDVAQRPDDLMEIAAYIGTPFSKAVKRGIRNAILKFNRYQLAKYKGEGKAFSMVDLFNLTHPKVKHATEEQAEAWKDLMEGNLKSFDTWENDVSNAEDEAGRKEAFTKLIMSNKMGYMAVLRNLNNFLKYNLDGKVIDKIARKIADPEEVAKSKQLPFRFTTAYDNVSASRIFTDAISEAMDAAVSNVPELPGSILIAVDSSGSMMGGADPAMKKASIFAATLLKANKNADVILYDTEVYNFITSTKSPVIDISKSIERQAKGGGTETSLVFQHAIKTGKHYDRFIIISDNESWNDSSWRGNGVQQAFNLYKEHTGTDPYVYAVDIQGYGTTDLKKAPKVFHMTGWSNRLLDFIGKAEQGETLVDYVKNYHLKKYEESLSTNKESDEEEAS